MFKMQSPSILLTILTVLLLVHFIFPFQRIANLGGALPESERHHWDQLSPKYESKSHLRDKSSGIERNSGGDRGCPSIPFLSN